MSNNVCSRWPGRIALFAVLLIARQAIAREPIPDKLVVLTFDDSVKSHFTVVRPILEKHGFGATFFITEGFEFLTNKQHYMTWEEIATLHQDGFEIGNHTRDHMSVKKENLAELAEQIQVINDRCIKYGIPPTTSFAYPGNSIEPDALPILAKLGFRLARRGGAPEYPYKNGQGFAYEPGLDHPLLIPSAGDARPDWTLDDFRRAVEQARFGRIAVVQFHGVPDLAHPWVHSPVEKFEQYMQYLADNHYTVVAARDLEKYVDTTVKPQNPLGVVDDRKAAIKSGYSRDDFRRPKSDDDLRSWLENMVWYHNYTVPEIRSATGLSAEEIVEALNRFDIRPETRPRRNDDAPLLVLPYPGGRHPRTGFLDGAIRPQRETKFSLFLPWDETSYVVVDVPEAIRRNDEKTHGLLYLAHTHVDTMWTKQAIDLEKLEWSRSSDGALSFERKLPNNVRFGTKVMPARDAVRMEMWLENGSDETLKQLTVQNCIMLKAAPEFASVGKDDRVIAEPYIACRSARGNRWLITAWEPCQRAWANPPCPCIHSDPRFPDCAPGEKKQLRGWISFYKGNNVDSEFKRLDALGWRKDQ
ncbi:MAG: polysaccharide deacetylase family protein [Planctomycetaceae bacterium]